MTVSDTGIGIPEAKRDRIFESFAQVEGSAARSYEGVGLGLSVTKKLVEYHGGNIWVDSIEGAGSNFSFTLPLANTQKLKKASKIEVFQQNLLTESFQPQVPTIEANQSAENQGSEYSYRVLIVDDDPANLQVLINNLSLENYEVAQASSGQEALDLLANGLDPDLSLIHI